MKKLMIYIGEGGVDGQGYGCDWYLHLKDRSEFEEMLVAAEELECDYDGFVIHFDGLDLDSLFWMIHSGRVTNDYEVRMHGSKEDYQIFRAIVDHEWKDQTGWFRRLDI